MKAVTRNTIKLALYYLLNTLTYASYCNIVIYLHEKYSHHGYGQIYLTSNAISALITYFFCSALIKIAKITPKAVLLFGSFGYAFNYVFMALLGVN